MAKKDIKFTLDTIDSRYSPVGTVKQLDSVFFYIKITENGVTKDLTGQTIKLFAIKEDKKIVEQTTKINITNQSEGLVEIELLNAAIQVHGFTYFELEISDSNGIISTSDFILRVNKRVGSDEAIESTNEVAALKKIEEYVSQAKVELQNFKKLQTAMLETNNSLNSQEELRVEAESLRITAEEGRVAAETKREEAFNKIEGRITANTEELELARTATTGEEFNSLDERIDCEVDRLNRKIEISFLQQEGKESHVIENTVDGMTKDMTIKGIILQNLIQFDKCKSRLLLYEDGYLINKDNVDDTPWTSKEIVSDLIKPSTVYTFIVKNISEFNINFDARTKSDSSILGATTITPNETKILKITTDSSVEGLKLKISSTDRNSPNAKAKVVLLEGDWTNKEVPSYFEGIKSFGQQEGNKISALSCGKNIIDFDGYLKSKHIENKNNVYVTNIYGYIKPKCIKPNTQYSLTKIGFEKVSGTGSMLFRFKYTDGSFSGYLGTTGTNTSNLGKSIDFIEVTFSDACYYNLGNLQLEEKINSPTYEPYKENKKDILLNKYGFDEGLRGFNLKSCDELNSIRNVAIKRIDKYIFSGDEKMVLSNIQSDGFLTVKITKPGVKNESDLICNNFANNKEVWDQKTLTEGIQALTYEAGSLFFIKIDKKKLNGIETIEGFKQWLKENETVVYYELAAPVETPLDENITLKTFLEKTYVVFENSLKGTSSFKAPVNAIATISRLNRENKALEEENLSLRQDLESNTLMLTDSDLALVKQNVDMDFRLMEVEFALDIPQAILSSDINFKNKKGEVKTMARTPYEMMKIVILSGDYDREDYMHKVGKYYERGRMTKEEHDELISLMTADEVISK